jgi:hypothetical protein
VYEKQGENSNTNFRILQFQTEKLFMPDIGGVTGQTGAESRC